MRFLHHFHDSARDLMDKVECYRKGQSMTAFLQQCTSSIIDLQDTQPKQIQSHCTTIFRKSKIST